MNLEWLVGGGLLLVLALFVAGSLFFTRPRDPRSDRKRFYDEMYAAVDDKRPPT